MLTIEMLEVEFQISFTSLLKYWPKLSHLFFSTNIRALNCPETFDSDISAVLTARSIELQTDGVQCRLIIRFWFF